MSDKTPIRRDPNLLAKAKKVFGDDLVTDAFVCTFQYKDESIRLDEGMHKSPELDLRNELSYDTQTIRLVFCNGRTVDFDNSEWASMHNPFGESYEA